VQNTLLGEMGIILHKRLRNPSRIVFRGGAKTIFAARELLSDPSKKLWSILESGRRQLYALLMRLPLRENVADDLLQELVVRLSQSNGFQQAEDPVKADFPKRMGIYAKPYAIF
jgi:hypothetical protein